MNLQEEIRKLREEIGELSENLAPKKRTMKTPSRFAQRKGGTDMEKFLDENRTSDQEFKTAMGLSRIEFNSVLNFIRNRIEGHSATATKPEYQLIIFLHFITRSRFLIQI